MVKKIICLGIALIMLFGLCSCGTDAGDLQRRVEELESQIARQAEKNAELENEIKQQAEKNAELENELKQQAEKNAELEKAVKQQSGLSAELAELKEQLQASKDDNDELRGRIEELEKQKDTLRGQIEELEKETEAQDKRIRELEDELELKHGVKPDDLDDPMPQVWEHDWDSWDIISEEGIAEMWKYALDAKGVATYTIGADILKISMIYNTDNLKDVYVHPDNPVFTSEDGVLYSKSFKTLYKWPAKKNVTKPKDSIKYFARWCYSSCYIPGDFELPDGTISIGDSAFASTINLTSLHIKKNVKTVGVSAFAASENLKRIEISAPIAYMTFFRSQYIETLIFNEGVKQIRVSDGNGPGSGLRRVEFPNTLEAIGGVEFRCNARIEIYTIPKSVRYIDDNAFTFSPYQITQFNCKSNYAQKRIEELWKLGLEQSG